jgi:cobalt/nickel transport system permease protein
MHIPDGFFDARTSLGAGAVAVAAVAVAARRTRAGLDDRQVPLAALTAAFVFAAQMLTFPVASGTSGHLLGGVLAAVLVGPWTAAICLTVVLGLQALLFADGGLTAIGLNVVNVAVVGGFGGYLVFRVLRPILGLVHRGRAAVPAAAGLAALLSVPLAAAAFTAEYALGGAAPIDVADLALAMVGTHALIGVGEGLITAFAVGAVVAARPDLVHGAAGMAVPAVTPAVGALHPVETPGAV